MQPSDDLVRQAVNTIKMLAVDAVQKANSGHPGLPMGAADYAFEIWYRYLRFNPEDPGWINRDRFVLSAGHGSMLLYALLHLAGYDLQMSDLQTFRQFGSRTPGHPEYGETPGVETTTGPLGQGFANGVGMAIAAKMMAARFNTAEHTVIDSRVYGIVSDGDLMEGIASEAASIAGHLGLDNLVYVYDDNKISIAGSTDLSFSEDAGRRFEAYGWFVQRIDGHDHQAIVQALDKAEQEKERPSLIVARTHIAHGSPNKHDTAEAHGAPLGEEEVIATKKNLGWPVEPAFYVPEEVRRLWAKRVEDLRCQVYDRWQATYRAWRTANPDLAELWDQHFERHIPEDLEEQLLAIAPKEAGATRIHGSKVLQKAAELVPALCGGSADLEPSTKTIIESSASIRRGDFRGRNLHFGVREHGMGGIVNGMALYGGTIPYGSTFLVFSDYMRPSVRLAAMMGIQVLFIYTHDSIFLGEDGPTHQPIEQLAALRLIPNLTVMRPADGPETALAYAWALRHRGGPTAFALTRQKLPPLERSQPLTPEQFNQGAYVVLEEATKPADVVLVASGSEVGLAVETKPLLEKEGYSVRVVSMPCQQLFLQQPAEVRDAVVSAGSARVVAIEAGRPETWCPVVGPDSLTIGLSRFGASAPYQVLAKEFGFVPEALAKKVIEWLRG
jgi:transketolase